MRGQRVITAAPSVFRIGALDPMFVRARSRLVGIVRV